MKAHGHILADGHGVLVGHRLAGAIQLGFGGDAWVREGQLIGVIKIATGHGDIQRGALLAASRKHAGEAGTRELLCCRIRQEPQKQGHKSKTIQEGGVGFHSICSLFSSGRLVR